MCDNNFTLPVVNTCNTYNPCNPCNPYGSIYNQSLIPYCGAPFMPFSFPNCQNPCTQPTNQCPPPSPPIIITYSTGVTSPQSIGTGAGCVGINNWNASPSINIGNGITVTSQSITPPCSTSTTPLSINTFKFSINGTYLISVALTWQIPINTATMSGGELQISIYY